MIKFSEFEKAKLAAMSRRALLGTGLGAGLGSLAAMDVLGKGARASIAPGADLAAGPDKGAMGTGLFPAKAQRVISMHMWGAISQVDTLEYKPKLWEWHGKEIPASVKGNAPISAMTNAQSAFPIMKPLAPFKQYGQSGRYISDLMPHLAKIVDDLTFVHSMHTDQVNHDPAAIFLNTGFQLAGRPSAGAWVNYALGTDNAQLPSYVVLKASYLQGVGTTDAAWSAGFLPSYHQGVEFRSGAAPVLYVGNPDGVSKGERRAQLDSMEALAREQYKESLDPEIMSKITQYEMAYRMQDSVPEVADISDEPDYILDMYGPLVHQPGTFARNCLLTRRLIERGVKFVQLIENSWDHHSRISSKHPVACWAVDQPSAALVTDLKQRGLLDDTLVVWGGEFGRTSYAQGVIDDNSGRDHHGGNFTYWLAGGGTKPGTAYGETDEFSYNIVKNPVSIHDLHATMLYLMGIDHKQLTYHYQGRDYRLTDVSGDVIQGILA